MKNKYKILVLVVFLGLLSFAGVAYAEDVPPNFRAGIPGQIKPGTAYSSVSLAEYVEAVYLFAMGIVGIAALVMIIVGGYQYMFSSVNPEQKKVAVTTITNALLGLALAICSYLILKLIDPDLLLLEGDPLNAMETYFDNNRSGDN